MTAPRWTVRLLNWLAAPGEADDVLGDLEESHRARSARHGRWTAALRTSIDALDMAVALLHERFRRRFTGQYPSRLNRVVTGVSWLDVKIALRMLFKQPGITVVAIFALAIGIPVGLLPLHVLDSLSKPLPVENGEQIVLLRNYDRSKSDPVTRSLHDFVLWRGELSSFEQLAMWRTDPYNVNSEDGRAEPVRGSEITASAFTLLRVPPLLGRPLTQADEATGAPDVAVIGYDLWRSRFLGDPNIVGKTICISGVPHAVVGVMPSGFQFPYRDQLWLPFRHDPQAYERGAGPAGVIAGRLKDGVSIEEARTELEFFGQRMAKEFPDTHAQLQPQILPYTAALTEIDSPEARIGILLTQILAFLLLALACGNVGILTLARVATRTAEIAVRTALGASRLRIVSQLFIESLVLAVLAAGAGLLFLQAVATSSDDLVGSLPFWVDFEVSTRTAVLALSLAVASAAIAGVMPALKATGKHVQSSIQSAYGSGIRFGKAYSALVVGEVAVALLFLALGSWLLPSVLTAPGGQGIDTEQYLAASLRIPRLERTTGADAAEEPEQQRRVAVVHEELKRRVSQEAGVGRVAIASALPGMSHAALYVQVEGLPRAPEAPAPAHLVNVARVDVDYFGALGQRILQGRNFSAGDLGNDRSAVIVNSSFVERVLGGRNPIGQRLRYWEVDKEPGPWAYEIVGVVGSLGMSAVSARSDQGMYHVVAPGELHPVNFAVHVGADPERFITRVRSIVSSIDPSALIQQPARLSDVPQPDRRLLMLGSTLVALIAAIAIVLATACLYALMSFTVAKRTRECAIRTALGARPASIVSAIANRVFLQLTIGAAIGALLSAGLLSNLQTHRGMLAGTTSWPLALAGVTLIVITIGVLACIRPTLRLIRIRPVDALKSN